MPFNSLSYLLFLPAVYTAFALAPASRRRAVLLAASVVYYGALLEPHLLLALAGVGLGSYWTGIRLAGRRSVAGRRILLWGGVAWSLSILVGARYLPFLSRNVAGLLACFGIQAPLPHFPVLASVGVSFFVFQAISYLVDVYLEVEPPERDLGLFLLYLAFFPKLLQGPIERAGHLIPQLRSRYVFDYDEVRSGLLLFGWGLFKKVVIADRLGLFVDAVYDNLHGFAGLPLALATWIYALQIYYDFSGYTDMARGTAALFGIRLTQNFNSPYLATSIADFWRRWHISFSRWILDYLFKPLQFAWRDWRERGTALALIVTFLASGLWHGANWSFVVWGALHGALMAAAILLLPWRKRLHRLLHTENTALQRLWRIGVTFNLVCLTWVFFRAPTLSDAAYVLSHVFAAPPPGAPQLSAGDWALHNLLLDQSWREAAVALLGLATSAAVSRGARWTGGDLAGFLRMCPAGPRWTLYLSLLCSLIVFAVIGEGTFIYYQF
jgi:D-alanyl-lipoteichoic acid acyltransferase DltB (MBOAT superfamily)